MILNILGRMDDGKFILDEFWDFELRIVLMCLCNLLQELIFVCWCQGTWLIKEIEDAEGILIDEIDDGLIIVVFELSEELLESFLDELMFFRLEDVGDVELLQLFIGEVDAQLLEGVDGEILESKYVKQPNGQYWCVVEWDDGLIEFLD